MCENVAVQLRRLADKWEAFSGCLPLSTITANTRKQAIDSYARSLVVEIERLRRMFPHEMCMADARVWKGISSFVDWDSYHLDNPEIQVCCGQLVDRRGDRVDIRWLLAPVSERPRVEISTLRTETLPPDLWSCPCGSEFEARVRPPRGGRYSLADIRWFEQCDWIEVLSVTHEARAENTAVDILHDIIE
jgi:hypothetical protein